ncbi:MAG: hypothetical protein H5U01_10590 [Clostridia bacterium]|nr:hypothetical protein [Clostridia bacterium]
MGDNTRAQSAAPDGAPACEAPEEGKPRKPGGKGGKECPPDFAAFWAVYPRKVEKQRAYRAWKARVREGHDPDSMVVAAVNYAAYCRASGTEERYIKHPATFVGPDKPFLEWLEPRASPNPSEKVPKAWAVLREYLDEQREGVDTS